MRSKINSRVDVDVINMFINSLTWGYRRYNYWAGNTWLTGKLPIGRDDALRLVRDGEIIGVWQCYSLALDEDCVFRDVVVFEADIDECEDAESRLECVVNWARERRDSLRPILNLMPTIWWNGNKSLYFINYLLEPVVASAELRRPWVKLLDELGMDMAVTEAKHAFRVPGTPHPRTGNVGKFLSLDFSVINKLIINRVPSRILFEDVKPPAKKVDPRLISRVVRSSRDATKKLPNWVQQLIEYLRKTGELCHYGRLAIAEWLLYLGHSEDEIVDVFKAASDFNEERTRYHIKYAYEHWISQGRLPISCKTVRERCNGHEIPEDLRCPGEGS